MNNIYTKLASRTLWATIRETAENVHTEHFYHFITHVKEEKNILYLLHNILKSL